MKIINCGGYGNTGCTAQTDFLGDHQGVIGALPPFHELGILKCFYSFGGIIVTKQINVIAKTIKNIKLPNKKELRSSLLGIDPEGQRPVIGGALAHLEMRQRLNKHYGDIYQTIVDDAMEALPDSFEALTQDELIDAFKISIEIFTQGLFKHRDAKEAKKLGVEPDDLIIGFKNDPPGAYPLLNTLLPKGSMSSAILRDPRDTTYDFNRHYGLGHTFDKVQAHCKHYNSQLNSARSQIQNWEDKIRECHIVLDFENLVSSEKIQDEYRNRMIGNRDRIRHQFNPELSAENIGHYTKMQTEFVAYVEEKCMENYNEFRKFLLEREILVD